MPAKGSRGPWLWPLALALVGVALLLNNFLLLNEFDITTLWPLLLVVAGGAILLRGDLLPSTEGRTFGITRGSVESGTLEISSGEVDVILRHLQQEGRLIAGQFALHTRPTLQVQDTHAHLKLYRSATPWLSFSDWEMGLSRDLPWGLYVSTSLGQVNLDLSRLIVQGARIGTGFGDIRLTAPQESFDSISARSTFGDIHFITPPGYATQVTVRSSRLFNVRVDENRYQQIESGVYRSRDADVSARLTEVHLVGTFGDAYLT
jgi:hypothetical protein